MITVIFLILLFGVFGKLIGLAFRVTFGLAKILLSFVLLPIVIIGLVYFGLMFAAIPILLVVGLLTLLIPVTA